MDLSNISLRSILERIPSGASPQLLDELGALLRAELARPSADTGLVVEAAYSALQQLPATIACPGRVSCLLGVVNHYYRAGRPEAGVVPAREAVAIARKINDESWLCRALKCLGLVLGKH